MNAFTLSFEMTTEEEDQLLAQIESIVKTCPRQYSRTLRTQKHKKLYDYIIAESQRLADPKYDFRQRVEWVINQRSEFPRCKNPACNKVLDDPKHFHGVADGYSDHCCMRCSTSDPSVKALHAKTCAERHDGNPFYRDIEKDHQTRLKIYGNATFVNPQKAAKTKAEKHGKSTYNNSQQAAKTYASKTGYDNPARDPDVQAKMRKTYVMHCLKKYGTTSYFSSDEFKAQSLARHGCENPMQSPEMQRKAKRKHEFKGIYFDTKPEIAFFIYLTDHRIRFEYHNGLSFDYEFEGKTRKYFPDFVVEGEVVELKGDHFFKDGKMVCPFRRKEWSDERYQKECQKYEAKHQCMLKNDVKILTSKDYQQYLDYVKQKYGKGFLDQFKRT